MQPIEHNTKRSTNPKRTIRISHYEMEKRDSIRKTLARCYISTNNSSNQIRNEWKIFRRESYWPGRATIRVETKLGSAEYFTDSRLNNHNKTQTNKIRSQKQLFIKILAILYIMKHSWLDLFSNNNKSCCFSIDVWEQSGSLPFTVLLAYYYQQKKPWE